MTENQTVSLLYAFLAGLSLHATWLTWLRPYVPLPAHVRAIMYLALTVAFTLLAVGRANLSGFAHGVHPWVTRGAFIVYGLTLVYKIGLHWRLAWQGRRI